MTRQTFIDANGAEHDFDSAVMLMDDEIREAIHAECDCETNQQFIEEYARRHLETFGEEFVPFVGGNW